ncbi:MAG: DUF2971 domain-containing protein [Actinomycetia bacterium]|nr:DUF2971 domain-containing protein [Actinomycetes bacterium]
MYEEHPFFKLPAEPTPLWRYLDFVKLVALLDSRALHFCRSDYLGDPFEGSLSEASVAYRAVRIGRLSYTDEEKTELAEKTSREFRKTRYVTYINCWHIDEEESMAMWHLYAPGNGVAIKSTCDRLTKSFPPSDPTKVNIGMVRYEHQKAVAFGALRFLPYLVKRRSFAYERELRAVTTETSQLDKDESELDTCMPPGKNVPVDLTALIESIHVSPEAATWFLDLVKSVVHKFGCSAPVTQSRLAGDPLY